MSVQIHPDEIKGTWDQGYVLDRHTLSSTMIGYNEFGHPEFDTVRSELGELLYRLKYKGDKGALPSIVEATAEFVNRWGIHPDVLVPIPPSRMQRAFQPVLEIARELAKSLGIALNTTSLAKSRTTPQMKDVGDFAARVTELESAFTSDKSLAGRRILLVDDLYQSGATMNVAARTLKENGEVAGVFVLALTRTRS